MEKLQQCNILFSLLIPFLFHFSSLSFAYTLPKKYFINCGSDTTITSAGRNFTGDVNSTSIAVTSGAGSSRTAKAGNPFPDLSSLYKTARVFAQSSSYELELDQKGTHMVRLHFYPFSSPENLPDARFNVFASEYLLLSNFSVDYSRNSKSPVITEFLLTINGGKFSLHFAPFTKSTFAFVNAIEVFPLPEKFIPDFAPIVTPFGSTNSSEGLLTRVLKIVRRINVGGPIIKPENDTLWRNWVPDDDYLFLPDAAKNSELYRKSPKFRSEGASEYIAPVLVYQTAKELNIDPSRLSNVFNVTWNFRVRKNARHLVRSHFCDIVSSSNGEIVFDFYIGGKFSQKIDPYARIPQLGAPFYLDFVVESDNLGFLNISIGPRSDSSEKTAFLNGVEIFELNDDPSIRKEMGNGFSRRHLIMVVGSVVGGLAFACILITAVILRARGRKGKAVQILDSPMAPLYWGGGSPFSTLTEITANDLNLGLKIPIDEILFVTKNFDSKLMIGRGGFGKVYKGTLSSGVKVAVKRSEPGHGQGLSEFQTEIILLSKIRHRHLVSLIGYCDERSEMILVYEFMEKGTLNDHLYSSSEESERSSSTPVLSWNQRLQICIGAARGLHYLHTGLDQEIIHRDIKSTNILLDVNYVAKVADFGLSRSPLPDQTHVSTAVKGSFGYLDPEYCRFLQLTQKSDVYSFGVVLLEVLCARPAINTLLPREQVNLAEWGTFWQRKGQIEKIVDPLLVGKINPKSLRKFGEIAEKCLREYGVDRPSMHNVMWDLEYTLELQQNPGVRELPEDSTTDASWKMPLPLALPEDSYTETSWQMPSPVVQRSTSQSVPSDNEEEMAPESSILMNDSDVFSQLRIDGGAR